MKSSLLYRISAVLLVLFAAGHTLGFRKVDPRWGVDSLVASMRTIHFLAQGFDRTYYDFYAGFGLFVSVFLLFAAVLAWQLGSLPKETLALVPLATWSFALCFVVISFFSWKYFFMAPVIFSCVVTLCLLLAAWLSTKPS